jgi:hypothetical protein
MTFAIIIIIAFFALSFLQRERNKTKAFNHKKSTKTNVELQKKIAVAVSEIIEREVALLTSNDFSHVEALERPTINMKFRAYRY